MKKYMFRHLLVLCTISCFCGGVFLHAQEYDFRQGSVSFSVLTPARTLTGMDSLLVGQLDITKGTFSFQLDIKGLHFNTPFFPEKANQTGTQRLYDYYLEGEKYPYAYFKGKIKQAGKVNFQKEGNYKVKADGVATIHGVSQQVVLAIDLLVNGSQIIMSSSHIIKTSDYKIRKPESIVASFMDEVRIHLDCIFEMK